LGFPEVFYCLVAFPTQMLRLGDELMILYGAGEERRRWTILLT
jgi:hypothetical protein